MPPHFVDLDPWVLGEQTFNSAPRTFQQEEPAPNLQRTVSSTASLHRPDKHSIRSPQADANCFQPSKRKHPNFEPSPPEQTGLKKHKSLSETDLGIIRLAARILEIPVASLLAAQSDVQVHSEGSSTTYDSLETPSTGPEQTDGYEIQVEPARNAARRPQPAPTSAPVFQLQTGAYEGNPNAGYQEPHTFRDDLDINSKNHLAWWGLDDFNPSTEPTHQTNPPIRQEPQAQMNDWGHTRFDDAILTPGDGSNGPNSWIFAPQEQFNGYHGPGQSHNTPIDPMPHPSSQGAQLPQPSSQTFGLFNLSGQPRHEARTAHIAPQIIELDENGDISGAAFEGQDLRQIRQNQAFPLKRPRPRTTKNSGDGRKPGRRGPLTEEQRRETSLTRKKGACIRCQRQQIKVYYFYCTIKTSAYKTSAKVTPRIQTDGVLPVVMFLVPHCQNCPVYDTKSMTLNWSIRIPIQSSFGPGDGQA